MLRRAELPTSSIDARASNLKLLRDLLILALPLMVEHALHIGVGLTDTWLANHIDPSSSEAEINLAAGAAIGPVAYATWFLGIVTGAVGTGSTALIARATGAKHRGLARSALGQSILLALAAGLLLGAVFFIFGNTISRHVGLANPEAQNFVAQYIRILAFGAPLATITFVGNACLRGAGDTITPAIAMVVIDLVNIGLSFGLCYGWGPFPQMGFAGIAWGTTIAYGGGSFVVLAVLLSRLGRSDLHLYLHRLKPDPDTIRRILRIGIPSGLEGIIFFSANYVVVYLVNTMGQAQAAAHNIVIRIEALSFMTGFAVATAAATMVGQSLGMKDPHRARKSGWLSFMLGGGIMVTCGLFFIAIPTFFADLMADSPSVIGLSAQSLRIVGFSQIGFAAMMIFGGALRGAGDTTMVMLLNLGSAIVFRVGVVWVVVNHFGGGLAQVWLILAIDLCVRGFLLLGRFYRGGWETTEV